MGYVNARDRIVSWGEVGAICGSIGGLLLGTAMLFIPGIGYVMFAGWLVAALEGAMVGVGVGAIAGALASLGIPNNTVVKYEWAVKEGGFLLIVHGDESEVANAKSVLEATAATSVTSYTTRIQ